MAYVLSIIDGKTTVNETNNRNFTVAIRNDDVNAVRSVDYVITGVSPEDLGLSSLEGTFNLTEIDVLAGSNHLFDTVEFTVTTDVTREGLERFALSLKNDPSTVVRIDILDTSFPAVIADEDSFLTAQKRELRTEYFDNGSFTIDVNASGPAYEGISSLPYIIHGPASQFITPNSGTLSLSGNIGSITFTKNIPLNSVLNDLYFELQFDNQTAVIEFPIFRERPSIAYELIVDQPTISQTLDNRTVTFTLITTGLDTGTVIPYTCFGDLDDVTGTTVGNFTLNAAGTASISLVHRSGTENDEFNYDKTGTIILRLDNGQAQARVTLRRSTTDDSVDGMMQVAAVLDNINNNMIQHNVKMQLILQSIVHQLMDIREDLRGGSGVDKLARLAENQGIKTKDPYADIYLAAGFKQLILEGGILRKDAGTKSDDDVREMLDQLNAKPDQELKGESLKYLRNLISQARSSLGDL